ncbi:predicted protein [Nematostella vectensis]|uniref:Ubiquitin-specific peptidase-like SUMO isopeptidase domain-containing protein n=1 Tax=Nematostella vectensis TaxID=45351 RepID=A7RSW8_NEMVE|nr:predicted protein [Nematostella vectensis]|eukprot:XP_001637551.1 predicted protein [Nematostella vectensis]
MAGEMVCELCGKSGVLSHMSIFQLNFGEAVLLCENPECVFPLLGGRLENYIIQRKASEMSNIKRKKKKKQPSLKQKLDAVWIPGRQEPCASSKEGASTCSLKSTSSLPKAPSPYSGNKFLEVCDSLSDVPMETEHCSFEEYIQWCNSSALCWLDCVLSLLVFNKSIKTLTSKISSSGSRLATLQETYTKALDIMHMDQNKANNLLSDVRQSLWDYLKPKMKCKLGVNDSPVFALPLILRENSVTSQTCLQEYTWQFHCNECGFSEAIRRKKHVVTVPNTPGDFTLPEATFVKTCPKCGSHSQKSNLVYDKAPSVLFLHLVEGLRSEGYHDNEFNILDQRYRVTQFIQYKHNPDHFVCWTKQNNGKVQMDGTR